MDIFFIDEYYFGVVMSLLLSSVSSFLRVVMLVFVASLLSFYANATESAPASIDTRASYELVDNTSAASEIDTREFYEMGRNESLAGIIDTREESEKLDYKYQLWVTANAPLGQRGMEDVTDYFGISNLLAFALGWEKDDRNSWYRAGVVSVTEDGANQGVLLRTRRRGDLPELMWQWKNSDDLTTFTDESLILKEDLISLGGVMEQWDILVPLPDQSQEASKRNFYQLEIRYENQP